MSKITAKKLCVAIIAILILSMFIPTTIAQTVNAITEKALTIIRDVLPLDFSQYNASLALYNKPSAGSADADNDEFVTYNLENNGKVTTVHCSFKDNRVFTIITTAPLSEKLLYVQPSSPLEITKTFLDRYNAFLADDSLNQMIKVLSTVDSIKNATIDSGDIRVQITTDSRGTLISLKHVYNSCPYDELSIAFPNEQRMMIGDMQSRYKMGDTTIKVSEQQAIETAIKYIENYSYEAVRGTGKDEQIITVSGFNISKAGTTAELTPAERNGLLYPTWKVTVGLEDVYPGNVYGFTVTVYADTGEFLSLGTLAVGADMSGSSVDNYQADPSPQANNVPPTDIGMTIAAIGLVSLSAIAITLFVVKKTRSK